MTKLMDSEHVKESKTLLKSARHYFSDIFWSLSKRIRPIKALLEVGEILRLFLTILTPDNKYILSVKASVSRNQFKCSNLKTEKTFLIFFLHSRHLHKNFNTFKKNLNLKGDFLLKLQTGKNGVTSRPKKTRIRTLMKGQYGAGSETLLKSARQCFCDIFW